MFVYSLRRILSGRWGHRDPAHPYSSSTLSPREIDILQLLAVGTSTVSIAKSLGISIVTVRNHVPRLGDRLGSHSCVEAAARDCERAWID